MKRLYFLVAVAALQIVLGSITLVQAAQPIRMSQDVLVPSGTSSSFSFSVLGTGWMSGNLSELQGRSFDVFVFDDRGYAAFRDGSSSVPPLFQGTGMNITVGLSLPGTGTYYLVVVDPPNGQTIQVHVGLSVGGLNPSGTIVALIVLVGGMSLLAASLMLSAWAWRRTRAAPSPSSDPVADPSLDPPADPLPDPSPGDPAPSPDPPDDTRIY